MKGKKAWNISTEQNSIVNDVHPEKEDQGIAAIEFCNTNLDTCINQQLDFGISVTLILESNIVNKSFAFTDVA